MAERVSPLASVLNLVVVPFFISKFNDTAIDHEEIKEFVAEPWFILLLAGVVTLMVIFLAAILFVRYRQLGAKKSHMGGTLHLRFNETKNRFRIDESPLRF